MPANLSPELKQQWIEALESGKYNQTVNNKIAKMRQTEISYCCLGILLEIQEKLIWHKTNTADKVCYWGVNKPLLFDYLTDVQIEKCIDWNDGEQFSFCEIAQKIREEF